MKMIGTFDLASSMGRAIRSAIPTAYTSGVDIYLEDDGSVHIYPHKLTFDEAEQVAGNWLDCHTSPANRNISFCITLPGVIVCTNINRGKIEVGTARFNEKDEHYSTCIGKALAYSRATGKPLPDDLANYLGIKQ